ncbi:MAG: hypothetical protein B0D92_05360 [Spirochaeta sp. LUC14_002_19_P3]|nr:MAG: hypothetical protein B0D92_05360 [Spirochaeta sp. LUC14_002_19_P3]
MELSEIGFREGTLLSKVTLMLCLGCILAVSVPFRTDAQALIAEEESQKDQLEDLLDTSLSLAAEGKWEEALKALEEARKLSPDDERITSYEISISELKALEDGSNPTQESKSVPDSTPDKQEPKFVIERDENSLNRNPAQYRDLFRGGLAFKIFVIDPLTNNFVNTWSSLEAFAYSSFTADVRVWMPFIGKSLGFNARSSGYSWPPKDSSLLVNILDLGGNLRGFLLEDQLARMEIGFDFGASMFSKKNLNDNSLTRNAALFLGLWISEPLFYHLFKTNGLAPLLLGGGIRIYAIMGEVPAETLNYYVDGRWQFKNFHTGIRLEWWNFPGSGTQQNPVSFSVFFGAHFK